MQKWYIVTTIIGVVSLLGGLMRGNYANAGENKIRIIYPNQPVATLPKVASVNAKAKKPMSAPQQLVVSENLIKKLIVAEIDKMIAEGRLVAKTEPLTGAAIMDKLHEVNKNFNPEQPGFQPYYIPAAAISDVGTFFSVSNVGAENLSGTNAALNNLEVSDEATFASRATFEGGMSIDTPEEGNVISTESGAFLSQGGDWTNASSKDLKENFVLLDGEDILAKIDSLSITRWNYKKEASSTTHIGPTAEDFYAAFKVGGHKDETSISTIDPAGVALAGVQALSKKFTDASSWLTKTLEKVGILVQEGLVYIKTLATEAIQTNNLEVGSTELPSGITLYDETTKQPYCVKMNNGSLQLQPGGCMTPQRQVSADASTTATHTETVTTPEFNQSASSAVVSESNVDNLHETQGASTEAILSLPADLEIPSVSQPASETGDSITATSSTDSSAINEPAIVPAVINAGAAAEIIE